MRCGIGAIGDRGIDFILDAIERVYDAAPRPDSRPSSEHCSLPTQEALERMKRLDVTSSTSVGFGWELEDQYRGFMGMEWMKRYIPMRSFKEMGIIASGNADYPVCSANIMEGICLRQQDQRDRAGPGAELGYPGDGRARLNGAYITFEEDIKGSIEPGKLADFAVLDTDILTCNPGDIHKTKVVTTIVDGKVVYKREG